MFRRIMLVGLLTISMGTTYVGKALAYVFLGTSFTKNTYDHSMTYAGVKGSDFKNYTIFFESGTVWYDNAVSCCVGNNCKNEPLSPGIGHFTLSGSVTPKLDAFCAKQGKCTGTVRYPDSVNDLKTDSDLLNTCQTTVCELHPEAGTNGDCSDLTPQQCFNWLFYGTGENQHCRNKNDTVVQVFTKGICTKVFPETCDANNICTPQDEPVGVRFTFPSFVQKSGDKATQVRDDSCIACVDGTGPCPTPTP